MSGRSPPLYCTLTTLGAMEGHQTKQYKNDAVHNNNTIIVLSNHTTMGAYSLEHKERYDIITTGEEWYTYVLQQIPRDLLRCHLFSTSRVRVCISHYMFKKTYVLLLWQQEEWSIDIGQIVVVVTCYFCGSRRSGV